jgi:hypothetical protein
MSPRSPGARCSCYDIKMLRTSVEAARRELRLATDKLDQMDLTENDADHLADLWAEFLSAANRVFNKLSHGPKHGPSKGWFDHVKHVRKTDKVLSYILHARNADTHGVERIAEDSNFESVKIRPLSCYKDGEPIKGKIVESAIVHEDGRREFIQHMVEKRNPILRLVRVTDNKISYDPPPPGTYLDQELPEVEPIEMARIVANYLKRIVAEAENHVVPGPS